MKKSHNILRRSMLIMCMAASGVTFASPVTIPNSFAPNTTAVAAQVNANFTAVSSAINDNDSRITTNTTNITTNTDEITANTTAINANTTAIQANTSEIASNSDRITALENGPGSQTVWVSVNARSFSNRDAFPEQKSLCVVSKNAAEEVLFQAVSGATTAGCDLVGGVQLPHGATIISMKCGLIPGTSTATVSLHRERYAGSPIRETITTAPAPALFGGAVTTTSSSIASGTEVVDNSQNSYFIFVNISTDNFAPGGAGAGGGFRFMGCAVELQM